MLTQLPNNVPVIIANDSKHSYANQETNHLLPQANDSESATSSSPSGQSSKESRKRGNYKIQNFFVKIWKKVKNSYKHHNQEHIIINNFNINYIMNINGNFFNNCIIIGNDMHNEFNKKEQQDDSKSEYDSDSAPASDSTSTSASDSSSDWKRYAETIEFEVLPSQPKEVEKEMREGMGQKKDYSKSLLWKYIADQRIALLIIVWLHDLIDTANTPKGKMMPFRAVDELGIFIRRVPYEVYVSEFSKISIGSYYYWMKHSFEKNSSDLDTLISQLSSKLSHFSDKHF